MVTGTSVRGKDTRTVPSGAFSGFSTPVADATAFSSIGGDNAGALVVAGALGGGVAFAHPMIRPKRTRSEVELARVMPAALARRHLNFL